MPLRKGEGVGPRPSEDNSQDLTVGTAADIRFFTREYCNQIIETAAHQVEERLSVQFPSLQDIIHGQLSQAANVAVPLNRSVFSADGNHFLHNMRLQKVNQVSKAVFFASRSLGVKPYLLGLYPYDETPNPPGQRPGDFQELRRYPWFNARLGKIVEVGTLPLNSPIAEYIAASYITQVGKNYATHEADTLKDRTDAFEGVKDANGIKNYIDSFAQRVQTIRHHTQFVGLGLNIMANIAKSSGFDEQNQQMLSDLAFLRERGFDSREEFDAVLTPLIQMVARGDWNNAFAHRDFLLRFFGNSFPDWRVKKAHQDQTQTVSFNSMRDLIAAIRNGSVALEDIAIPPRYREVLSEKLAQIAWTRERSILRYSYGSARKLQDLAHIVSSHVPNGITLLTGKLSVIISPRRNSDDSISYTHAPEGQKTAKRGERIEGDYGELIYALLSLCLQSDDAKTKAVKQMRAAFTKDGKPYGDIERIHGSHDKVFQNMRMSDVILAVLRNLKDVELNEQDPVVRLVREVDTEPYQEPPPIKIRDIYP